MMDVLSLPHVLKGAGMPLSDHEQQLLDQLEKQLRSEDPRFAQNIAQPRNEAGSSISAKRFVGGCLLYTSPSPRDRG